MNVNNARKYNLFFLKMDAVSVSLDQLQSQDDSERLKNIQILKNEVIGSHVRKLAIIAQGYVGAVTCLLRNDSLRPVRVEAAVILGSIAHAGSEGLIRFVSFIKH